MDILRMSLKCGELVKNLKIFNNRLFADEKLRNVKKYAEQEQVSHVSDDEEYEDKPVLSNQSRSPLRKTPLPRRRPKRRIVTLRVQTRSSVRKRLRIIKPMAMLNSPLTTCSTGFKPLILLIPWTHLRWLVLLPGFF
jgi:hypothetical protein